MTWSAGRGGECALYTELETIFIVVIDGGSSDQTVPIVERIGSTDPRVRVLTTIKRLSAGV